MENNGTRPLYTIADEIHTSWTKPYFGAVPYIGAMRYLGYITDPYGEDDAVDVVLRFLANAGTWRGDDARRIKSELKAMLKAVGK